jgi:hypothetical protein
VKRKIVAILVGLLALSVVVGIGLAQAQRDKGQQTVDNAKTRPTRTSHPGPMTASSTATLRSRALRGGGRLSRPHFPLIMGH